MGVITSAAMIVAGMATTATGMMNKYNTGKGASALADAQGYADELSFERSANSLRESQRQQRGSARAKFASGDSGYGQDQPLMLEAVMLNDMAKDVADVEYAGESAVRGSQARSLLYKNETTGAMIQGAGSLISQGYKGYSAYRDAKLEND